MLHQYTFKPLSYRTVNTACSRNTATVFTATVFTATVFTATVFHTMQFFTRDSISIALLLSESAHSARCFSTAMINFSLSVAVIV